jgi:hypothetical protein
MNVGLIFRRRITRRNRDFRWRQLVDRVRRVRRIRDRWLFNHAGTDLQHDCRKGVHD